MKSGKKPRIGIELGMGKYELVPEAERDLLEIALYGFENFGLVQTEQYYEGLVFRFQEVANYPLQYQSVDHIRPGYRRSVYRSHSLLLPYTRAESLYHANTWPTGHGQGFIPYDGLINGRNKPRQDRYFEMVTAHHRPIWLSLQKRACSSCHIGR